MTILKIKIVKNVNLLLQNDIVLFYHREKQNVCIYRIFEGFSRQNKLRSYHQENIFPVSTLYHTPNKIASARVQGEITWTCEHTDMGTPGTCDDYRIESISNMLGIH
jgi:hypothetical protein